MKLRLTLLAVAAAFSLAAAYTAAAAPSKATKAQARAACSTKVNLGFSEPLPDPNYDLIYGMIASDIKKAGGKTQKTQANLDANKQIADIQSMVSSGVNVLVVAPVNPQSVQPALDAARAKGVKLIGSDVFIGGPYATNIATSPYDAGYESAQYLHSKVGSGQVAAILAPAFAGPVIAARNQGFLDGAEKFGLNVVDKPIATGFTPDDGAKQLAAWKAKYGSSLKGVWIFNDTLALAAPSVLDSSFSPAIVSINGNPPNVAMIQGGKELATWNLHPEAIAHATAWAAENAVCKVKMPSNIFVPVTAITASNASRWVPWTKLPALPFTVKIFTVHGKSFVKIGKNP
jgi:ribose transport system substrate-binding protein